MALAQAGEREAAARARQDELELALENAAAAPDLPTAARQLGDAIQRFPDRWEPRAAMARLAASAGQISAAIQGIELALEIAPEEPSMLADLAGWQLDAATDASATIAKLRAVAPDHPALPELDQRASATRP